MRFWTWLLARLGTVAVMLAMALWWRMPASGEREFRRTIEALKSVNSVHYSMVSDMPAQHTEQEADLLCSEDAVRSSSHIVAHQGGKDFNLDQEIRRIGNQQYTLQPNGLWTRGFAGAKTVRAMCQEVGIESYGYNQTGTPFEQMLEHGIIEKGDKRVVDGSVCREWRVTLRNGPGPILPRGPNALEHRTVCLGVDDHLPREMTSTSRSGRWSFAFNSSPKVETPTDLVPERAHDDYRPPAPGLTLSDDKDDNH